MCMHNTICGCVLAVYKALYVSPYLIPTVVNRFVGFVRGHIGLLLSTRGITTVVCMYVLRLLLRSIK